MSKIYSYGRILLSIMPATACIILVAMACQTATGEKKYLADQVLGISFVASRASVTAADITPIKRINATWVSLMPYGFVRKTENIVHYNAQGQWFGETVKGLIETAELCKKEGLKIMIKPQIWLRHGEYTGAYLPPDSTMIDFKKSFENFVLDYARVAKKVDADLFCIGTEWQNFIDHDPEFWLQLIGKVKNIYSGPLTYAANWDEYKTTPFWHNLDYIGVNAYFPLSDKEYPTMDDLQSGWAPWIKELSDVAESVAKPMLFTEYGYRSTVSNASKPWESYTKPQVSMKNQELAYKAMYIQLWQEPWFAGGFSWKWFHNHEGRGGAENTGFTPQNKPAEEVIRAYYGK